MVLRTVAGVLLLAAVSVAPTLDAQLAEYAARRAKLTSELAGDHCSLGTWCEGRKSAAKAREHFRDALALKPTLAAAQAGLTRLGGVNPARKQTPCQLRLRNGERVSAALHMDTLSVQTDSGVLFVPLDDVHLIHLGRADGPDLVVADAFYGEARVLADVFPCKGKIGSVRGTRKTLAGIRLIHPCPRCNGRIEWECPLCKGTGKVVEKKVCPKCEGKGRVKCTTCKGRGYVRCPHCGGKGFNWGTYAGHRARFRCSYCKRTGKLPCPDCQKGWRECPDCVGEPVETKEIVCPDCKGKKILRCTACKGTGLKPLPPDVAKELTRRGDAPTEKLDIRERR